MTLIARRRLPDDSATKPVAIRFTAGELSALRDAADAEQVTVSELIRSRVFDYAALPVVKGGHKPGLHDGSHPNCLVCANIGRTEVKA